MNIFINKGNLRKVIKQTNSGGDWVEVTNENQDEIVVKCASTVKNGTSFYQFTKTELDLSQILSNYTDSSVINKKIYLKVKSKTVNQILVNEKIYDIKGNYLVLNLKELLVDTQVLTLSFNQQENTEKSVIFEYNDSYPYIKLENLNSIYTDEEIKEIDLAGGCNANVVLGSGENILSFNDITDNAMGLSIGHIFRHGKKNDGKGVGFKLSLNERFYKNGDGYYYYEDGLGNLTKLESKFYYYQEGEKKVVSEENYSKIYYDENGKYFYKESENLHFEAFKESFNVKGLKTIEFEDNENIKYTFLSDKRTENIKQYEETIKNLKEKLNDFVTLDIETKEYVKVNILFSEDYNLTAKKILELIDNLQNNKTVIISETEAKKYINKIKDINNFNLFSDETKEKLINEINNEIIKNQKEYSKIFKNSYAEYYTLIQNYKKEKSQTAINFIQDGEIYKGFNYYGDLINVFDKFENYTVIEYGLSKINGEDLYKRIESVYNSDNKQIIFEYDDENGLLKSIISSTGQRTDYTYDTNNYLTKVEFNGKENFTLTYSDDGLITSITDSDKLKSQITYSGQKVASVKNISLISSISATSETESESDVITYNFTYSLENGKNSYCIVSYDDVREKFVLSTALVMLGDLTEYYLEKNSKVVEAKKNEKIYFWRAPQIYYKKAKKESLNKYTIENFSFNEYDMIHGFLDKNYNYIVTSTTTSNKYLNVDQTFTERFEENYTYDSKKEKVISKISKRIIYGRDSSNNDISNIIKTMTNYFYNSLGVLVKEESYVEGEESNGKSIIEYVYSDKGVLLQEIRYNSLDPTSKFYENKEYDDKNQLISEYNEFGNKKEYTYNKNSYLLEKEKNSDESEVVYGYDDKENLNSISITDENNVENKNEIVYKYGVPVSYKCGDREYYFTYDHKKRLTGFESNQFIGYSKNISDVVGQNKAVTIVYKMRETYKQDYFINEYFPDGRIKEEKYLYKDHYNYNPVFDTKVAYTYGTEDKINNVTQIQDNYANITHEFTYDGLDRVVKHKQNLIEQDIVYKDTGEIASENFSYKNSESDETRIGIYANSYSYSDDSQKKLKSISNLGTENYKYDKLGRIIEKSIPTNYSYDIKEVYGYYKNGDRATNIINSIKYFNDRELVRRELYTYDKNGNIISQNDNGSQVKSYSYDKLGRLIKEKNIDLNKEICYTYDEQGNILAKTVNGEETKYSFKNITASTYFGISYDNLAKVGNQSISYDFIGNPTSYLGANLTWTRLNLLNSYSKDGVTANFVYDKDKLLTKKTVGDVVTDYIWFDGKLIQEKTGDETITYYYGPDGIRGFSHSEKGMFYYRKNVFGDIIEIIDTFGTVKGKYSYTAFGECTILEDVNGIATANPFRYRGYYYDSTTNFYYLKSRYYDPIVCRFITFDDLQFLDPEHIGGLNLYAYCNNNPIMYVDPDGTWRKPKWLRKLAIGLAVVGTILVAGAITALTMGVGTIIMATTMAGAVIHGAAVGTLIGAGVGVVAGGIIGGVTSNWSAEGILVGMGIGFGGGAIIGAIVGGGVGALKYTNAANSWLGGKEKMINHFNNHGVDMGYKNVVQYTKGAKNVIKNGTYLAQKNAYYSLYQSGKYLFTGVGQGSKLITTFGVRSFTKTAAIALGLL